MVWMNDIKVFHTNQDLEYSLLAQIVHNLDTCIYIL